MSEDSDQDRTEEASEKRLREAREKGELPRSRELSTGVVVLIALVVLIRAWASTSMVIPRERLRIAAVERGAFVRDVSAQGTVVVADSPTLFASGIGTVTFLVKAGDAVKEVAERYAKGTPVISGSSPGAAAFGVRYL